MERTFTSIFAKEFADYCAMRTSGGYGFKTAIRELALLDRYLTEHPPYEKALKREAVSDWARQGNRKARTKNSKISTVRGFANYLNAIGIEASVPESIRESPTYAPYLFTDEELARVFESLDVLTADKGALVASAKMMPMLMRLLYGTGIRLGEALSLKWEDVDIENGVITVRHAKNDCERFVPMSLTLTKILESYWASGICASLPKSLVFEDAYGQIMKQGQVRKLFGRAVKSADIVFAPAEVRERGICPHCLRHLFTMHSFLKMESEGRPFIESAPYLSTYLGHRDIRCTDKYLKSSHTLHKAEHQVMECVIGNVFPEAVFSDEC